MYRFGLSIAALAMPTSIAAVPDQSPVLPTRQSDNLYIPFYGTSANGFTSAARGWNSYGLQAGDANLQQQARWAFDDAHFREQCGSIQTQAGFDYVCSIDSGWSDSCNGDANGVPTANTTVIPNITDLADFLHSKGLKLGVYLLPGAFMGDANKTVAGTNTTIGTLFNASAPQPFCRSTFNYSQDGVQEWHDSVVATLLGNGIDLIKLDYLTPGSEDPGGELAPDTSQSAVMFHKAIENNNAQGKMRLDLSWKLDRSPPYWSVWQDSAETLRTDQDVNNSGEDTQVAWHTVLRAIDFYRQFINEQTVPDRQGAPITIRPDMDNTYVGNPANFSGISDVQRYTMATHWIGAGANLITGSDLTHVDDLGTQLLWDPEAMAIAAFAAQWPMQPRNPSGSETLGGNAAAQLQAWVAGPSDNGTTAVVILANYGPDPCLDAANNCNTTYGLDLGGVQNVNITTAALGISAGQTNGAASWDVRRVWGGGGSGGPDHTGGWTVSDQIECNLGPGETVLYVLTKSQ